MTTEDFPNLILCFLLSSVREQLKELTKQYDKSENDLKALQSVGQVRITVVWEMQQFERL